PANMREAIQIAGRHSRRTLPTLPPAQQHAFLETMARANLIGLFTVCRNSSEFEAAYDEVIRWKGELVESVRREGYLKQLFDDPRYRINAERLHQVRLNIAEWYARAGQVKHDEWETRYQDLSREKEQLQRQLLPATGLGIEF